MAKPPPDNLGKRQYDLNTRTNDAFAKKVDFDKVKNEIEVSEVDKFFKIDLAAKCKNVDYILDILKGRETLYAYRALKKCQWIYDDEYSHIINPEYLEENIFPVTSMRVKRLILKTVAMCVRREDRAELFYHHCIKIKMTDIALKCLLFTSEEFKLGLLQNKNNDILSKKFSYIRFIIGKSFSLLEAYMNMLTGNHEKIIFKFRYLYPVDNLKYLELLEKYVSSRDYYDINCYDGKLDNKLSDDIMKKYKDRLFAKPLFYMNAIHKDIIVRNITADDAKIILPAILPSSAEGFWFCWFRYHAGKDFIDLLPPSEIYTFLKKIFKDKYPNDEFETHKSFYKQQYYKYMTVEEQEEWAMNQILSEKQVLGVKKDYLWYAFINFKDAFEEIKKCVIVTKEPEKRACMLAALITEPRSHRELEIIFKYYNRRHVNEPFPQKALFLDQVVINQNVFEFDDACWEAFYTLLLSVELYGNYTSDPRIDFPLEIYKTVALLYHILHEKEMPEQLMTFFLNEFYPHTEDYYTEFSIRHHFNKLSEQKRTFLFNYLYTFYLDNINEYKNKPFTHWDRSKAKRYFNVNLQLLRVFNVNPEIYKPQPKPPKKRKSRNINTNISDRQLLRELKKDKKLVIEKLPQLKLSLKDNSPIQINNFLRKIKIYFENDITENYLAMFEDVVTEELGTHSLDACIKAIFELGKESVKINLMQKYAPENEKINYQTIDSQLLNTQRSICRYASKSLPPVPLEIMLTYMKGDYVKHCLHLFYVYIAALPMSVCINLVNFVLDAPVSIQKHALRLAFQCFSTDNLKTISKNIWDKTKNVSLRSVIYKALFNRVVDKKESELYENLISFTLDIHEDDEKVIFKLIEKDTLPNDFLGEYKKATWKALREFKDKEPNIGRKVNVIYGIRNSLHIMDDEFVRGIVDEHLDIMFDKNKLEINYLQEDITLLYNEKWRLIYDFIFGGGCDKDSEKYVKLAQDIVKVCLDRWNEERSGKLIYQRCCWELIQNLNAVSLEYYTHSEYLVPIYEGILATIDGTLKLHEIYLPKWEMQLIIGNRRVVKQYRDNFGKDNKRELVSESMEKFGKEVGKLVCEYVTNKMYFTSVAETIKGFILKRVEELLNIIFAGTGEEFKNYLNDANVSLAIGLVEFETIETYLLALELLSPEITGGDEHLRDKFKSVIDTVLKYPSPEIQFAANQKLLLLQK